MPRVLAQSKVFYTALTVGRLKWECAQRQISVPRAATRNHLITLLMDDDSKMIGGYLREVTSEPPTDPGGHSTPLLHQKPTVVQKKPGPQGGSGLLQYLPPGSQEENKGYMFWGGERLEDKVRKRGIKLSSRTVTGLSLALEADDKRRAGAKSNPMDKGLAGAGSKDKVGGKDDGTSIGKSINISNDDAESDANKSITSFHSNEAGKKKKKRKLGE